MTSREFHSVGYVYVFLREDGLRKLGSTINVRQRRMNCSMESGVHNEIEAHWESDEATAVHVEHAVHNRLRSLKVRGHRSNELYDLPLKRLSDEVDTVFDALGVQPTARWRGRIDRRRMFRDGRNKGLAEAAGLADSWAYGVRLGQSREEYCHALATAIRELQR
jgi:hypothetical protein